MKYWRKPLDHEKWETPKGEVHIIDDRCKGCGFCIEFCPTDVLIESEKFNTKGYHPPEVKYPEACIACKLCELLCPDFSIYVIGPENEDTINDGISKTTETKTRSKKRTAEVTIDA